MQALNSLAKVDRFADLEVLVCGSVNVEPVRSEFGEYLRRHPNVKNPPESHPLRSLYSKRNLGWQLARTELVAYLDDDVVLEREWAQKILEPFSDPEVGIVSGPGLIPDNLGLMARLAGLALSSGATGYVADRYKQNVSSVRAIKWSQIIGCNMALRRHLLEKVGGFNPFFEAGDEMFVSHSICKLGHSILFASEARAYHFPRATLKGFMRQIYGYGATRIRLIRKGVEVEPATLIPSVLVVSVIALAAMAMFWTVALWLLILELAVYLAGVMAVVGRIIVKTRRLCDLLLLLLVPVMHTVYGIAEWHELLSPQRKPV
jgi:GT2 family glycosyltransferase